MTSRKTPPLVLIHNAPDWKFDSAPHWYATCIAVHESSAHYAGNSHPKLAEAVAARCVARFSVLPSQSKTPAQFLPQHLLWLIFAITHVLDPAVAACGPFADRIHPPHPDSLPLPRNPTLSSCVICPSYKQIRQTRNRSDALPCLQVSVARDERADPLVGPR